MAQQTREAAQSEASPVATARDQTVTFPYRRHPDQDVSLDGPAVARHPVVVVGAGPVGLALAIDLALQDVPVVLLNNDGRLCVGSRALCFAKRTLEIFDRLGCGQRMVDQGVSWHLGRVFFHHQQVYQFDLLPEPGHERPAFINLQQYYVEGLLVERAQQLPLLDLRWHHEVVGIEQQPDHARLTVRTPEGDYPLLAEHVVACDGARSPLRGMLGLDTHGRTFKDRFLIADVRMRAPFPAERWFWFDPPFHPGQSVLLHRQPDGVWRIDFQLGWDADPEVEKRPENILPRVRTLMAEAAIAAGGQGEVPDLELVWASVYTFACMRMDRFRHGRVLFAGDAAHGVSPFGARGANSGVQDAENLAWKLAWVVQGRAPQALLDSYASEREFAADENIRHASRSTDFITPKTEISRLFRNATLTLAQDFEFARKLVNSGRLSTATVLEESVLSTKDETPFGGCLRLGAPLVDAPVLLEGAPAWLLRQTLSGRFSVVAFADDDGPVDGTQQAIRQTIAEAFDGLPPPTVLAISARWLHDATGLARQRYDGIPGTVILLRPDQHVCARWRRPDAASIRAAVQRATACA
ncbi:3-(3-hydroxy-phenyl)propionate hydroxylase [Roseateles sp. YR242]|uniref:FAD-dependent oxidoreductase n=1 Tax=Roseateles sp. YR242 TaxID=1855305 RepID=UPI0008CA2604|nr:FAD-dependent oxidoreductase [Roseateles sp. YR242]SEL57126.1 3-(3-hydroxy-phenyl)propionate hydroxylase [Roseateles sp. YR242]